MARGFHERSAVTFLNVVWTSTRRDRQVDALPDVDADSLFSEALLTVDLPSPSYYLASPPPVTSKYKQA